MREFEVSGECPSSELVEGIIPDEEHLVYRLDSGDDRLIRLLFVIHYPHWLRFDVCYEQ